MLGFEQSIHYKLCGTVELHCEPAAVYANTSKWSSQELK